MSICNGDSQKNFVQFKNKNDGLDILSINFVIISFKSYHKQSQLLYRMIISFTRLVFLLIWLANASSKLFQVVSQFRHGARYHLNSYYDGNSTKQLWGELSAVGMRQHENFGKILRKQYIQSLNFLSSNFQQGQVQVFSTLVNRTIQSVRSQLYGLYPLGTSNNKMPKVLQNFHLPPFSNKTDSQQQIYSLPYDYQPFIININDSIVMTDCKNWDKLIQRNVLSQKLIYDEMVLTYYPFLKRMGQVFNIPAASMNFSKISSLYDTLTVDKFLGRPMPKQNFTEDDYLNMRHLHYWYNYLKISANLSKAINTGKLKKVIQRFDERISNPNMPLKWSFLSAHDTDISGMLLDLNFTSAQCVEELYRRGETKALNCDPAQQYVSNILFELHSDNQQDYYVKIKHDGKYLYLCQSKNITCPYKQWKERVSKIFVNTDEICFQPIKSNVSQARYQSSTL